jgi:hypothetical protein
LLPLAKDPPAMPIIAAWPVTDTSLNVGLACGNACETPTVCACPLTSITAAAIFWPDAVPAVEDAVAGEACAGWTWVVVGIAELEAAVLAVGLELTAVGTAPADAWVPATASVTCCANGSLLLKRSNEKSCDLLLRGGTSESGRWLELAAAVKVAALVGGIVGDALAGV